MKINSTIKSRIKADADAARNDAIKAEAVALHHAVEAIRERFSAVEMHWRPSAADIVTLDLVPVDAFGAFVRRSDVGRLRAIERVAANDIHRERVEHLAAFVFASLVNSGGNEAAALVELNLNYHDDRGDGLLWVPAFRDAARAEEWRAGCRAYGIESACLACLR